MKILWLASWYPNKYEPFNGDFIQRHAQAVAEILPIDVIHIIQAGSAFEIKKSEVTVIKKNDLTEYIYVFAFKPWGIDGLDKIRYNMLYHSCARKAINAYIKMKGLPSLIHVHVPVKAGLTALYIRRKYNIQYLVSEQSSHYEKSSPYYFLKRTKYFQKITKRIFKCATAVTNVSETIGEQLKTFFDISNYKTIHNLADTNLFYYKPRVQKGKMRLIHVSALGEQKNPAGIIEALSLLTGINTEWECTICGPYNERLKRLVIEKGLHQYINFTGEISYAQVAAEMQQSDIFILFSNHENFPCVVVEALCCGLPVIATNTGGIAEAVNGSNGKLIEVGNVAELANAINEVMLNYKRYDRETIAAVAGALYSKQKIGEKFLSIYKQVIKGA